MALKRVKDGPHWVKAWISELSALTDQFRDIETGAVDFEALGREEYHFRMALSRRDFSNSERARKVWEDAVGNYQQRIKAASKKTTEGAANGNNADESATAFENLGSPKPSTDGDTRKDSLNMVTVRKNGTLESGTSVEKFSGSQNDQLRAGGHLLPSSSLKPPARSGAVDVLNLAYAGEFGNVKLTQEQYAQLGIKFGNQQKLNRAIDSLSCQIENGEKNPANHYAELVKWASYREDMEEQKIQQSETPKMTEMEKSWIREAEKIARYEKELAEHERR